MKKATKNAIIIGVITISVYLTCYIFRNMLSLFTPQLLELRLFDKPGVALFQSAYMILYAGGQLINGVLGDYIKPKIMISLGILMGGIGLVVFPYVPVYSVQVAAFGLLGFGMSMLRGPMMKLISENTEPKAARLICTMFCSVSCFGPMCASIMSVLFQWKAAFTISALFALFIATASFISMAVIEKKGIVKPIALPDGAAKKSSPLAVFRVEKFIPNFFLCMVIEIIATTISFWVPTYLTEQLGFSATMAGVVFTLISAVRAVVPFFSLWILHLFKEDDVSINIGAYVLTAVFFTGLIFTRNPVICVILILLAKVSAGVGSSMVWSVYIPSLGKTGKTSSANGVLDCAGYLGASFANMLFAAVMVRFDWSGVILLWVLTSVIGLAVSLGMKLYAKNKAKQIA